MNTPLYDRFWIRFMVEGDPAWKERWFKEFDGNNIVTKTANDRKVTRKTNTEGVFWTIPWRDFATFAEAEEAFKDPRFKHYPATHITAIYRGESLKVETEEDRRLILANELCLKCYRLAEEAHKGQTRRYRYLVHNFHSDDEAPYFEHVEKVARRLEIKGACYDTRAVAYLHDTLEDTDITADKLREEGIPANIIEAVEAMTKQKGESYMGYLERVAQNGMAKQVKVQDMLDNISDNPTDRQVLKYAKGLAYLLDG